MITNLFKKNYKEKQLRESRPVSNGTRILSYILISLVISANLFAPISVGWSKNGVEVKKNEAKAENSIKVQVTTWTNSNTIRVNVAVLWGSNNLLTKEQVQVDLANLDGTVIETQDVTMVDSPDGNNNQAGVIEFKKNIQPDTEYKIATRALQFDRSLINPLLFTLSLSGKPDKDPLIVKTQPEGNTKTLIKSESQSSTNDNSILPPCGITTPMGCVGQAFYYVIFQPTSYLFAMSGIFFDSSFAYSVQDSSYRSAFVVQGWGLVRDFCNLFFIFIMLYIAIGTILNLHSVKTKETIINVVIIGLFINFSLFATQVIIDASNITARVFYNSNAIKITEKGVTGATDVVSKIGEGGVIPLSSALVNKINPQNLIIHAKEINKIDSNSTNGIGTTDTNSAGGIGLGQFILIIIMASAVNIVGFTVFITVGFLFFARVIGLWLAMVLAPLAFFTYILPELSSIKMIGWKNWWPDTLKMAFLAPVFIFFMYLILKFLEMDLISDAQGKSGVSFFVAGIIPFVFIMIFMIKAKKIAVDMSGEFSEMVTKAGSAVGGMALGGAVGLGATAMRGTVGRLGSAVANSERVKKWESKGYLGASTLRNIGSAAGKGSFDVRNTKAGGMAGSGMGVDMGKAKEGGFVKARAEKTAARQKRAKELELGPDSPEAIALRAKQVALKQLENAKSHDVNTLDGQLTAARQKVDDANKAYAIDPSAENKDRAKTANQEVARLNAEKGNITNGGPIKDANGNITGYHTTNGKMTAAEADKPVIAAEKERKTAEAEANEQEAFAATIEADNTYTQAEKEAARETANDARTLANNAKVKHEEAIKARKTVETGKSINDLKLKDIPDAEHHNATINNQRKSDFADFIQSDRNKVTNFFSSGGVHSSHGADEASDNIRRDLEVKSSTGGHGGGGASHSAGAAHAPASKPAEKAHAEPAGHDTHHK